MNKFNTLIESVLTEKKSRKVKYSWDGDEYEVPYKMYYLSTAPNGDVYASTAAPWKYDKNWGFTWKGPDKYEIVGYTAKINFDDPMATIKHIKE